MLSLYMHHPHPPYSGRGRQRGKGPRVELESTLAFMGKPQEEESKEGQGRQERWFTKHSDNFILDLNQEEGMEVKRKRHRGPNKGIGVSSQAANGVTIAKLPCRRLWGPETLRCAFGPHPFSFVIHATNKHIASFSQPMLLSTLSVPVTS